MSFYAYQQRNINGFFQKDDNLDEWVFIESRNADHADRVAQRLGVYFDGVSQGYDCKCCGNRWERASYSSYCSEPTIYSEHVTLSEDRNWIVHYASGMKRRGELL